MNNALFGFADKTERLLHIAQKQQPFLLIDDGPIADAFLQRFPRAKLFDITKHSFNPLRGMDYAKARAFAAALYTASPEGKDTLTVRNGKRAMARLLLNNPSRLDKLKGHGERDEEALATIEDLLLSPVLRRVLCNPTNFSFKGSVVAKLDRAVLGDFDAFVLASLLIGQHQGHTIVPDSGFFLKDMHVSLIRQNRLTCGLNSLSEVSDILRHAILGIKQKEGHGCLFEDAEVLAKYRRLEPSTRGFRDYVDTVMG
jgi:hypothetical protein